MKGRRQMRGNAEAHRLVAPGNLTGILELLASSPGKWTPIAGGTELMVAHAAGKLAAQNLVSLGGVSELRFIDARENSIVVGAGSTFHDLRADSVIASELPLLAKAATWIGAIANQSRATLGGNLVNASPAADSSPALLVYDAEVELISTRGSRRIAYSSFHAGYKRTILAPDELLFAVHFPRAFAQHKQYLRKVGTRRSMAIAKVALAGTALVNRGIVEDIRLGAASLAPYPTRLIRTESAICRQAITPAVIQAARRELLAEASPIDDIRSTAEYRRHVGANLLEEFLSSLNADGAP
jgi:CO/xanthine dehydrogenase FAD-binding subunit